MLFRIAYIIAVSLLTVLSTSAVSADISEDSTISSASANIPVMEQVTVVGQPEDQLTRSDSLDREQLDKLPAKNGSINELLDLLPGIQLGDLQRTSDNAGEITPPNLSISGGRFYENNFSIDGFGNNSLLDPAMTDTDFTEDVPGHPQEFFINTKLVENATVYRNNIPAKYGQFTGGVVELETKDPSGSFSGDISLRHTRSDWTVIHKDRLRHDEYRYPDGSVQPDFSKYAGSVFLDVPVMDNFGALFSYTRTHSRIPLYNIGQKQNQYRTLENFFLKAVATPDARNKLSISAIYTPYDAEYFLKDAEGSRYTLSNRAHGIVAKLEHQFDTAQLEFNLGYRQSTNQRRAPDNFFIWSASDSKPWGAITDAGKPIKFSDEGGRGNLDKSQTTWETSLHVNHDDWHTGDIFHHLSYGVSYEWVRGTFDRDRDHTKYSAPWPYSSSIPLSNLACTEEQMIDCIPEEQFMVSKSVFPEDHTDVNINFYDAYVQDRMEIKRMTLQPGLRLSSEDFLNNTNIAPRLAVSYDLFGNGQTLLRGGWNRYYGKALLTHALLDKRLPYENFTRSKTLVDDGNGNMVPQAWLPKARTTIQATRLADLKTPYSDETLVGLNQQLYGGRLDLTYLEREGHDELATNILDKDADGYTYTEWTNDGRSSHKEASLSYEWQSQNHAAQLAATWQETQTTNGTYQIGDRVDYPDNNDDGIGDPVWYRGDIVDRSDLPRPDYNREFTGSFTYIGRLPHGFSFTNVTRYRSGYETLAWDRTQGDNGMITTAEGELRIYDEIKQPASWIFDWKLDWEKNLPHDQGMIFSLEINNVFNEKVLAGASTDTYELGRQFWLGMTYKF